MLHWDIAGLLPGTTDFEHLLLKEMVEQRATSLQRDARITRGTVLTALRVGDDDLLPASNLITAPAHVVVTAQSRDALGEITAPTARMILVHAAGGIGKSVLTTQVQQSLPPGSLTLVYDCFGNGQYRMASQPRHQHRKGLTQLANELATHTLCDPLLPIAHAHPQDYLNAFMSRLRAAAEAIAAREPGALLTVVIDAADNAVQQAQLLGERSFVVDLLRERIPDNVRILMLCRTERIALLDAPPQVRQIELAGFTKDDTGQLLRSTFGDVAESHVGEFHRMTGGNPRVQAFVLESADTIEACLAALGQATQAHGAPLELDELLRSRVAHCKELSPAAPSEIDSMCEAIAALRPRIPIKVLGALCDVPNALVHSFVADLGRPLLIDGAYVQFRDEPTETWFRTTYRPTGQNLDAFIARLTPLTSVEPYAAASLPELLWEADQLDTLVQLAMTDAALPEGNDLEQREIAQQRAQYALKAALREGHDVEATRVALKAGVLAAGRSRTLNMFRNNPDLAGQFLDAQVVEDLVATRGLAAKWPGSHLQYEGALLSVAPGQSDLASSRLRTAQDMQIELSRPTDRRRDHPITAKGIAEVAFGLLHADSVEASVTYLTRWRPNRVAFKAGQIVARRLVEAGKVEEWERLGRLAARRAKYLQFAVADAGWYGNMVCTPTLARSLSTMLRRQHRPVSFLWGGRRDDSSTTPPQIPPVVWIVAMGIRHSALTHAQAEQILLLHLPATLGRGAGSWWSSPVEPLLCGFALLAHARQQPFDVDKVAGPDVVEAKATQKPHTQSQVVDDYNRNVVPLAPWATLWVDTMTCDEPIETERIDMLFRAPGRGYSDHDTPQQWIHGTARMGARVVAHRSSSQSCQRFLDWYRSARTYIGPATQTDIIRAASAAKGDDTDEIVLTVAQDVFATLENTHLEAQEKVDGMVALTRAIQRTNPDEAREYFHHAIHLTDRIGDDAFTRWRALLALTTAAADPNDPDDRRAYRVAQFIEGFQPYVGEGIEYSDTLSVLGRLSATTAIAAASRWRDRGLCSEDFFIRALSADDSPLAPNPVLPLALLPFDATPDEAGRLERALRHNRAQAPRVLRVIGEATWRRPQSADYYATVDRVVNDLGLPLTGTCLCPTMRHVAPPRGLTQVTSTLWDDPSTAHQRQQELAAERAEALTELAECDLTTVNGWETARALTKPQDGPLRFDVVADQAAAASPTRLAAVLAAFLAHPSFSLWEYKTIVERFTRLPLLPQAARAQLRYLATQFTTRFCIELTTRRHDYFDLPDLADTVGLNRDLQRDALNHLGSLPVPLTADQCFELAARLASRLTTDSARVALDDLSALLIQLAPDDFADGRYDALPPPPTTRAECVAGYLWAALANPETDTRWRAAHTVRLLIGLGCSEELDALAHLASGTLDPAPFVDAHLPFYDKHALLWLLLALARAAHDPTPVTELEMFIPLLERVAFVDPPHVLLRAMAASALLGLAKAGFAAVTVETAERARMVNTPTAVLPIPRRTRRTAKRTASLQREGTDTDVVDQTDGPDETDSDDAIGEIAEADDPESDNIVRFFWDFTDHWCDDVADAFGLRNEDVARMASQVVIDQWRFTHDDGHIDDPRHTRSLYQGHKTQTYKSSWPEVEDLDFYLATHALWTVAGTLVDSCPVYRDPSEDVDEFTQWLRRLLPTRDDGRWLADRRDPSPPSMFTSQNASVDTDWMWRLNRSHFTERLLDSNWITVWEHSSDTGRRARQDVTVRSALVSPDRARALLLALQTRASQHDGRHGGGRRARVARVGVAAG
jgi:hypothetical protein